ncbi:MAG: histidinol-phosphatase [Verrucomicrobia bacterium]|nr:MAG: histidinol-phosphatase [Verrucomicrobiota bacterium]PYL89538.1 MAG: histidinol-phosphatase [Verrucomicrobiota bacterium]
MSRCDLHIHSKFSSRSEDWLFRRFDFPDSCTEPLDVYTQLREHGMDFVTITDHDCIEGCLAIADKPRTFISEQVTTYFPQDPCKVHVLVWGITPAQHQDISVFRSDIFELQKYLAENRIAHAIAHPLYSVNGKLTASHLERLILLFKHFESINGLRDSRLSDLAVKLLRELTPAKIDDFANRHDLAASHPEPWKKVLVGGSDDHGGKFFASAFTETPKAKTPTEFLAHIRAGRCQPKGRAGTPLALSHGFYNTLSCFIQGRFHEKLGPSAALLEQMFSRFMEGRDPTQFTLREKATFVAQGVLSGKIFELAKPANVSLWNELSRYFARPEVKEKIAREVEVVAEPERRAFLLANIVSEQLAFRSFQRFMQQMTGGNLIEGMQALTAIAPLLLVLSPYIYGFHSQAPSRKWLREIFQEMTGTVPENLRNTKRAWFTDTLEDVNGVATTIRKMTGAAKNAGADLIVVTSRNEIRITDIPIKNFKPIGEFELPEYELQRLSFPPILRMLDYIQREGFTEIIISTPGPIGLTALAAAKMLNLQTSGIYHTDFPQYIRILTEDSFLESVAWHYMHWFYGQLDSVFVNSEEYRRSWIARGFAPEKLKILPRGLDTTLFSPEHRDPAFWQKFGEHNGAVHLLYVGRISKEKDLDVLAQAYRQLRDEGLPIQLYLVGDGPYLQALHESMPEAIFTGYLRGKELAAAYASADVFVFPSTTDTFGNVVIEAQASGVPVIVSDTGGPKELVEENVNGVVTKSHDVEDLARAIRDLVNDKRKRHQMSRQARQAVIDRSWPGAFRKFWAATEI